ncbi:hypothetical protein [Nannocystis sp. SCPEA4]|uniref:hypothetical protein n=1 Tax=Nannocystis sp. SCPEA4 TaxID=2996787 RepID=UPI00226FE2CC|nr:hypothetical protein [Nannocystis sp. SCPEA4]MCY1062215.1 hypothetical protein [Nannocystis sp. SCPEA4]
MTARLLPLLALVLAACDTLPELRHEGRHVRIGTSPGLELCAGTVEHMDRFVERMAAEFGVEPPTGDGRFTYYWLTREDFIDLTPCPREVSACAIVETVFSTEAPLDHELVHLFVPDGSSFFGEGIAVAYEGLGGAVEDARPAEVKRRDIWSSLLAPLWFGVRYDDAGAFVAYLLDRHGIPAFLAALPKFPLVPTRARLDRVFREEFGLSLAASVAEFAGARERCPHLAYDRKLMECNAPAIAWDGEHHAEYRRLAADEPDAVGPYRGDELVILRTLEVSRAGDYEIQLVGDPLVGGSNLFADLALSLVHCGGCDDEEPVGFAIESQGRVTLPAGRYSLRLHASARIDTRVAYSLTRVADTTPR